MEMRKTTIIVILIWITCIKNKIMLLSNNKSTKATTTNSDFSLKWAPVAFFLDHMIRVGGKTTPITGAEACRGLDSRATLVNAGIVLSQASLEKHLDPPLASSMSLQS